ncbi:MAG: LacI family DNA-binding transcriptional regulator [Clostridia bacterium]|nr:LacI family DNA-binding transcriptional regulator [Clostridia bacterium]
MANRPRIEDICEKLHLSKATVSKALNGYDSVREETRVQVLACAREIGYAQARYSEDVKARYTRIGITMTSFAGNPHGITPYQPLVNSLMGELEQYHYETVLIPPSVLQEQSVPYEQAMRSMNLDCAFLTGLRIDDPYYKQIQTTELPTVLWDMSVRNPVVHCVSSDSTEGMRLAASYLIELGHRRIGLIMGHRQAQVSLLRRDGYMLALLDAGLPIDPELIFEGDYSETAGALGFYELMKKNVTGILCVSDTTALGVYRAAMTKGLRIPEDLSIIGYDNTALTSYTVPGLTSVDQHSDQVGKVIATTIHNMMRHRPVGDTILHPSLVIRGSTAAPGDIGTAQ